MTRLSGKPERPPPPPRDATRPPGGESAPLPRLGPLSRSFPHPPRPATPPARSPLLGGGGRGRGSRLGARGRCPTCLRRGRPAGCRFPSCPPRSVPPRSAWRPWGSARRPPPHRPADRQPPGPPRPTARGPGFAGGRRPGVSAPHTCVPASSARPPSGPSAAPAPATPQPPSAPRRRPPRRPRDGTPHSAPPSPRPAEPPPPGAVVPTAAPPAPDLPARLNQASSGGGGQASALLCLSLARLGQFACAIG